MNPSYFIVLSRAHAEELFPSASDRVIEQLANHVDKFGAVIAERDDNVIRPLIAENGRQITNRITR